MKRIDVPVKMLVANRLTLQLIDGSVAKQPGKFWGRQRHNEEVTTNPPHQPEVRASSIDAATHLVRPKVDGVRLHGSKVKRDPLRGAQSMLDPRRDADTCSVEVVAVDWVLAGVVVVVL